MNICSRTDRHFYTDVAIKFGTMSLRNVTSGNTICVVCNRLNAWKLTHWIGSRRENRDSPAHRTNRLAPSSMDAQLSKLLRPSVDESSNSLRGSSLPSITFCIVEKCDKFRVTPASLERFLQSSSHQERTIVQLCHLIPSCALTRYVDEVV